MQPFLTNYQECIDVWKKGQEIKDFPPLWGDEVQLNAR